MFKRIFYEDWTTVIPFISFWLTFSVFLAITAKAYLLKQKTVERLEQMPLEDDETSHINASHK